MRELNGQQRRFCDEYIVDLNAYQAAIRAGYSKTTAKAKAYKWLEKVGFRDYIDGRLSEKDADLIATQDEVLKALTRVLRREEMETKVVGSESGPVLVKIPTRISDMNKAAELLAKGMGLLLERVELTEGVPVIELNFAPKES